MPRAEDDTSLRGQPYGAEAREAEFVEATGGASTPASPIKQVQIPVSFDKPQAPVAPDVDVPEEPDASLETPFGNLGDYLFGETERPEEPWDAPFEQPGPEYTQPIELYRQLLQAPNLSPETRASLELLIRLTLLGG